MPKVAKAKKPRKPAPQAGHKRARANDAAEAADQDSASESKKAPMKTAEQTQADVTQNTEGHPKLSGKFDIYVMELDFLTQVYRPRGTSGANYKALYDKILTFQAKNDRTARIYLPDAPYTESGLFTSGAIMDPMQELPFDFALTHIKEVSRLPLTAAQKKLFITPPGDEPGISAAIELADDHCGVASTKGVFMLKPAWNVTAEDGATKEIFEGYFDLKLSYSSLYRRKGHGSGLPDIKVAFWAVRARRDKDGNEIGIGPKA